MWVFVSLFVLSQTDEADPLPSDITDWLSLSCDASAECASYTEKQWVTNWSFYLFGRLGQRININSLFCSSNGHINYQLPTIDLAVILMSANRDTRQSIYRRCLYHALVCTSTAFHHCVYASQKFLINKSIGKIQPWFTLIDEFFWRANCFKSCINEDAKYRVVNILRYANNLSHKTKLLPQKLFSLPPFWIT